MRNQTVNNRKCPRCGSSDTAEILRGMPAFTEELVQAIDDHRIILGGCCISENDPEAHCNACGKDFGKPPYVRRHRGQTDDEPRELYPDVITGITFSEGGYFNGHDQVEIVTEDGKRKSTYVHYPDLSEPYVKEISNAQWKRLMDTLFNRLCIHEWKKKYVNFSVLDGTQWELGLKLTGGRHYNIYGSNDFPPLYKDLVRAFKPFMNKAKDENS